MMKWGILFVSSYSLGWNEIIEPIVVRGRDMVVYDGYARLHALKQLGKRNVLAYVGR